MLDDWELQKIKKCDAFIFQKSLILPCHGQFVFQFRIFLCPLTKQDLYIDGQG